MMLAYSQNTSGLRQCLVACRDLIFGRARRRQIDLRDQALGAEVELSLVDQRARERGTTMPVVLTP